jgi:N-acetylglucosaminyldiphosphoundecaprenol N-acetyl-beta-D-mannosaminyltransferase
MTNKCKILSVDVDVIDIEKTVELIKGNLNRVKGKYICVANVHTTVMAYEKQEFSKIQNLAWMVLPDGKPLSVISKMYGFKGGGRVTGPDLMNAIFELSTVKGYRHFFYGSTTETIEKMIGNLRNNYANLNIVGTYAPPFRALTDYEDEDIIKQINITNPDFIWVGLGAPKQEEWMYQHIGKLSGLMIGVGAGFDYFAGNIKRAPKIMQNLSLEWLYRLYQEPRRLWRRYTSTNFRFVKYLLLKTHLFW